MNQLRFELLCHLATTCLITVVIHEVVVAVDDVMDVLDVIVVIDFIFVAVIMVIVVWSLQMLSSYGRCSCCRRMVVVVVVVVWSL